MIEKSKKKMIQEARDGYIKNISLHQKNVLYWKQEIFKLKESISNHEILIFNYNKMVEVYDDLLKNLGDTPE